MTTAYVKIWDKLAGAIAYSPQTGLCSFEYDADFISYGWDLSPLKMPLSQAQRVFSFPELGSKMGSETDTFKGMPGLLADVLPDRFGSQLIYQWLTLNNRPVTSLNPVEMLCFIGQRGMGALEFEPAQPKDQSQAFDVELNSLVSITQKLMQERSDFQTQLNSDEYQSLTHILKIGTSAGGARPKAVIAYNPKTNQVKSGQLKAPKGFEQWLIKLDGVSEVQLGESYGYGRVEMAYYLMAKDAGIQMTECKLLEENNRAHFMTKRFDRGPQNTKHHIQTFCAIKHFDFNDINSFSYEQLFQTMRELRLTYREAEQMFRRMVFNVLARNCDDHTKNFSFMLTQNGQWQLAPAYDICYAYKPNSMWVSRHCLSINGKREHFQLDDLLAIGHSIRCKSASEIIQEINKVVSQWKTYAQACKVSNTLTQTIAQNLIILSK